jgi:hypothetical protein
MATGSPFTAILITRRHRIGSRSRLNMCQSFQRCTLPRPCTYAVLVTAPPSVLKLPVNWAAIKVPALSPRVPSPFPWDCHHTCLRSQISLGNSATLDAEVAGGLGSDQSTSAFSPVLSSLTSRKNPEIDPLGDVFRLLYLVSLVGLLY